MKENTTEYVILGILSNKPQTGYDIHKMVKTRLGPFWEMGYSQIYPTLRNLEKEGIITKKVELNDRGQNLKVYSVTKDGKNKLQNWLTKPAKPETFKFEALLKIAFGEQVPKEEIIKHIEKLKARNEGQLENALSIEKEMKAHLNESKRYFFALLTFDLGKKIHKTAIEWADAAIEKINNIDKNKLGKSE